VFGSLLGFATCELLYRINANLTVILTTSIIIAYASFVVAEHLLHVSGVMAVVGSAIALKLFGVSRFRQDATHSISETWEVIALSCNSLLFLMVGLSVNTEDITSKIGPVLIAIGLVLTARAMSVYSLVPLTVRLFRLPHVTRAERHIMWWGGLKGGLAIAVVLSIPADLPERQFLFDLTIGVVLFTLLISAPTIKPLMEHLGMNRLSDGENLELRSSLINARSKSNTYMSKLLQSKAVPESATDSLSGKFDRPSRWAGSMRKAKNMMMMSTWLCCAPIVASDRNSRASTKSVISAAIFTSTYSTGYTACAKPCASVTASSIATGRAASRLFSRNWRTLSCEKFENSAGRQASSPDTREYAWSSRSSEAWRMY
jgi:NhaP-type Na+/H+ and K+/H+ antiporter